MPRLKAKKAPALRGSVTQNNLSVRMRARQDSGIHFLTKLGLLLGGVFVVAGLVWWSVHSGWTQRQKENIADAVLTLTQKAQFAVHDIVIQGRVRASKADIYDALATTRGAPLFAFDAQAAGERLIKLPWISSAIVERRLPDTILVILNERAPAARWQHDDKIYVIDTQGDILPAVRIEDFASLPFVVGAGADKKAQELFAALKNYPDIQKKTEAAVRVGDRRWDLHLAGKITVRLPEDGMDAALHRLSVLISQEKILDRDIAAIDLRMADRLVIEPLVPPRQKEGAHL